MTIIIKLCDYLTTKPSNQPVIKVIQRIVTQTRTYIYFHQQQPPVMCWVSPLLTDRCEMYQDHVEAAWTAAPTAQQAGEITLVVQSLQLHSADCASTGCLVCPNNVSAPCQCSSYLWWSPAGTEPSPPRSTRPTGSSCLPFSSFSFLYYYFKKGERGKESRKTSLPARQHGRLCRETVRVGEWGTMIAQPVGGVAERERAGECVCVSVLGGRGGWSRVGVEVTREDNEGGETNQSLELL